MKELKQIYQRTSKQTQNRLQEIFDSLDFDSSNLYNIANAKTKKKINTYIEEWKEKGLLTGTFGMLANNIYRRTRAKNSEILELLIYSAYIEEQNKLEETELKVFKEEANYYYQQGQKEVNQTLKKKKKVSVIPDAIFLALLDMPNSKGYIWDEYIEAITKYNADQIYRQATIDLQQQKELDITNDIYQNIIKRQQNSRININDNKISGDIDLTLIGINNEAKVEGIYSFDDKAEVEFIAVEDERTTPMCRSLNSQRFKVHDWNEFKRYSASNGRTTKYRCYGLVVGLNCPPIDDHFHWCRSYIVYARPVEKADKTEYNIDNFLRTRLHNDQDYDNYINDYEKVRKEYDKLPDNIKTRLFTKEGVTVVFNYDGKHSGYNYQTKEILLNPNIEDGEFTHEVGHALEYTLDLHNNSKYIEISNKLFNNNYKEVKFDKDELYYGLQDETYFISPYQTYLGTDYNEYIKNYNNKYLRELISEGYRDIYSDNSMLEKVNKELYDFIREIEKNA